MSEWTIYHNPRCKKSREALQIIEEKGVEAEVVKYLEHPLSEPELKALREKLNINSAEEMLRKQEKVFKEHFKGKKLSENDVFKAIADYPKLMERPVVVKGNRAVIGRPPEKVKELL